MLILYHYWHDLHSLSSTSFQLSLDFPSGPPRCCQELNHLKCHSWRNGSAQNTQFYSDCRIERSKFFSWIEGMFNMNFWRLSGALSLMILYLNLVSSCGYHYNNFNNWQCLNVIVHLRCVVIFQSKYSLISHDYSTSLSGRIAMRTNTLIRFSFLNYVTVRFCWRQRLEWWRTSVNRIFDRNILWRKFFKQVSQTMNIHPWRWLVIFLRSNRDGSHCLSPHLCWSWWYK